MMQTTQEMLSEARDAVRSLSLCSAQDKEKALSAMAQALEAAQESILSANRQDLERAEGTLSPVMMDRLRLTSDRIAGMAKGIREVALLPDPVGRVLDERVVNSGLKLKKVSVPMGVVAIIYESRPNVTSDAAALCLKSGNVCILRCGKEAHTSSRAVVDAMNEGLRKAGFPSRWIYLVEDTTRQSALDIMRARGYVDLLIPRGGAGLIRSCIENAQVPCIETGTGICSVYVDESADTEMALKIIDNAKTQRPSVCNAEETLLVHTAIAESFLPALKKRLVDDRIAAGKIPVELRIDAEASRYIEGKAAEEKDFDTEFLDYILAVRVVRDVREAVEHIRQHSTHHSEAIVTRDDAAADFFTRSVDSAVVYVNASTRFTDGGMFGLGCEMGISTQKLHARGPMGLEELTSYKYIISGNGQIRG